MQDMSSLLPVGAVDASGAGGAGDACANEEGVPPVTCPGNPVLRSAMCQEQDICIATP